MTYDRLFYSLHALQRMEQMGVTRAQVRACVFDCEQSWSDDKNTTFQRDNIAVAVSVDGKVITVLPRTQEVYVR